MKMKLTNTLKISTAAWGILCAHIAQAEEYWVDGVTEETGWYDANKTPTADGLWVTGDQGDVSTCHAATAANLIAWWQDRYKGRKLPEGVPTDAQEIWQTYKNHQIADTAGTVSYSFQWWLTGVNVPESASQAARTRDGYVSGMNNSFEATNGYYYDEYLSLFASDEIDESNGANTGIAIELRSFFNFISFDVGSFAEATNEMTKAIEAGKGLALQLTYSGGSHALTLWGMQTNITKDDINEADGSRITSLLDDGVTIHKLWLTDSDDSKPKYGGFTDPSLFYVYVRGYDSGYMTILDHGSSDTEEISDRGLSGFKVTGITTIDPLVTDDWFEAAEASVPEPTTATLSLLGLMALASRRRRD